MNQLVKIQESLDESVVGLALPATLGFALLYYAKDAPSGLPKLVHYSTATYLLLGVFSKMGKK